MPHLRLLACTAIAVFAASWVRAELVEVTCDGSTVFTGGDATAQIPEYFSLGADANALVLSAVFDPNREPIAATPTSATYEALYGYGLVNDVMIPLQGVTLELRLADEASGSFASFVLSGTTSDGWRMWVDGFSEYPQFVPSLDFPLNGFSEPPDEYYRRCDIGASGEGWDAFSDQTFLPVCTHIPDPPAGGWQNQGIEPQYGRFILTYDVTPSTASVDAVTGLSRVAADNYTDLAPIVRFAPSGEIDVRNGDRYEAIKRVRYKAGVRHRVKLTIDLWTKRYSVAITPKGGTRVTIAKNFAFRSEHLRANELRVFSTYAASGSLDVSNLRIREPETDGLLSSGTWENAALPDHASVFTVRYQVTPLRSDLDAVTGLASGPSDWFDDLAVIVRFAPDGRIDARDGGDYRAKASVRYQAGATYNVRLDVNLSTRRYSASVQAAGGSWKRIADNYAFRTEQNAVTSLNTFALFSTGGGATEATNPIVQ